MGALESGCDPPQGCEDWHKAAAIWIRWLSLALLLSLLAVYFTTMNNVKHHGPVEATIYETSIASGVQLAISVIPVCCHDAERTKVRLLCLFVCAAIGAVDIGMKVPLGWAVLVGGAFNGLQWVLELLVCSDEFRRECLKRMRHDRVSKALCCLCLTACEEEDNGHAVAKAMEEGKKD